MRKLIILLVAVLMFGCSRTENNIFVPTTVDASNRGASPSPSPTPVGGLITRVAVSSFGEGSCEPGSGQPISEPATVRRGCVEDVTCTPKMQGPDGNEIDAPPAIHGPAPSSFSITSGNNFASFNVSDDNPFNGRLKGIAATNGSAVILTCVVKGVTGTKAFTVVQ